MKCKNCNSEQGDARFCGNCGSPIEQSTQSAPPPVQPQQNFSQSTNVYVQPAPSGDPVKASIVESKSRSALIWGIVSLVCLQFLGFLPIIFGVQALKASKGTNVSKGKAIAGIILGVIALVTLLNMIIQLPVLIAAIQDALQDLENELRMFI